MFTCILFKSCELIFNIYRYENTVRHAIKSHSKFPGTKSSLEYENQENQHYYLKIMMLQ